ncbi:hypothetical protein ACFYVL_42525 [Streptomyces sp. NPDC004111]|uniref:hypothetical protein n=1 Tax=Streptomyces sp. NPDC004111 TaxID=3364690 RepID=UPI0036BEA6EB
MSELTDAAAALRRVDRVESAAWKGSNWYLRFLLIYGLAQLVIAPALVLLRHPVSTFVAVGVNTVVVVALSFYAARQRTVRRGFGMRHAMVIAGWGVTFALTASLGSTAFHENVLFAVAATVACVLPFALGARSEIRRSA